MTRVAVPSTGPDPDSPMDPRFGRAPYFIIFDLDTMKYETVQNTFMNAPSAAGIQTAQLLIDKKVDVVLSGNVGPNAYQALVSAGIQVIPISARTAREAVEIYKKGGASQQHPQAPPQPYPPAPMPAWGRGGWGRRRGGWGWQGSGMYPPPMPAYPPYPPMPYPAQQMSREEEIFFLEQEIKRLEDELESARRRLKELKGEK
ncbi:NifB/NifX family molybdenum-iron cluster-binding protein [Candidatus Methanodesulfokora washburnensis]|uniref:Dinitrogenase iron-molybdenum cofactor biosynthesis protein n=1 Tax=Candidatus Methanodesulfokora washburnensis TaxID=2478471 RepID=A0A3R9PIV3_9CREN|nr:NifB/NifX family molybdenum-iron cluster-binding protein [Candidatus Methanodesulfokores washburnensis]RSN77679.1 dinitrogenase iron-molybdenum cofactor biosynthesis protein [Candidatus Methanodesulfokores washburnensis]